MNETKTKREKLTELRKIIAINVVEYVNKNGGLTIDDIKICCNIVDSLIILQMEFASK